MTKEKLTYVSPETETLVVRFEGMVCASGDGNIIPTPETDYGDF